MRITSDSSPLSYLSQRLGYASRHKIDAVNLVENVPVWPKRFRPRSAASSEIFHYAPAEGNDALLHLLVDRENSRAARPGGDTSASLTTQNLLVTNGATQGLSLILGAMPRHRKTILCQAPTFVGITALMTAHGFDVVHPPEDADMVGWMCETLSDEVAAIYVNTPHNPTGLVLPEDVLRQLIARAETVGAKVIIDAVYEDFVFDNQPSHLPRMPDSDQVVLINSLSKNFGVPGLRIGWVVGSGNTIATLTGNLERECVAVCGEAQAQAAGIIAQTNTPLVSHVDQSRPVIFDMLNAIPGLVFETCSAGTQVMVQSEVPNVEAFADYALVNHGLILATSKNYSGMRSESIRIPLGADSDKISRGLDILDACIRSYARTAGARSRSH